VNLTAVLGAVCTVLSVGFLWPQVLRVYRLDTVEGLSALGTLHGLAATILWTTYGVGRGVAPVIVSNGAIGVGLLMIAAAQVRHGTLALRRLAAAIALILLAGTTSVAIAVTFTGALAILVGVTSILPQTIHVSRVAAISGVSLPMYALVTLATILWTVYALLIGDWLLAATNVLITPCALFVAVKAWRFQYSPLPLAAEPG
jgi:uncharacterized protein with PQ loop repeat